MKSVLALAFVFTVTAVAAPLPSPGNAAKADLKAMQGDWDVIRYATANYTVGGEDSAMPRMTVSVDGTRLVYRQGEDFVTRWRLSLGAGVELKRVDQDKADGGGDMRGIYLLDRERLAFAFVPTTKAWPRPTGFAATGRAEIVLILRRK